jgi:hypothetical protein
MKKILLARALLLPLIAVADEVINYSNGATAFRDPSGHVYGYSGGANTGDTGFNDVRTGERYERSGSTQAVDTRTGQYVDVPNQSNQGGHGQNNSEQ